MTTTTYTTRQDLIAQEITGPLGEYAAEHDIEAIADELIVCDGTGINPVFYIDPDADFWAVVEANAL